MGRSGMTWLALVCSLMVSTINAQDLTEGPAVAETEIVNTTPETSDGMTHSATAYGITAVINGPVRIEEGELVILDARGTIADGFMWVPIQAPAKLAAPNEERQLIFATRKLGTYTFALLAWKATADGEMVAISVSHAVEVVKGPVDPTPGPNPPAPLPNPPAPTPTPTPVPPTPIPTPTPTPLPGKFGAAAKILEWGATCTDPQRATNSAKLAEMCGQLKKDLDDKKIRGSGYFLAATLSGEIKKRLNGVLGDPASATGIHWSAFKTSLGKFVEATFNDTDQLQTAENWAELFGEAEVGFKALAELPSL